MFQNIRKITAERRKLATPELESGGQSQVEEQGREHRTHRKLCWGEAKAQFGSHQSV